MSSLSVNHKIFQALRLKQGLLYVPDSGIVIFQLTDRFEGEVPIDGQNEQENGNS